MLEEQICGFKGASRRDKLEVETQPNMTDLHARAICSHMDGECSIKEP